MITEILIGLGILLFFAVMLELITVLTYGTKEPSDAMIEKSLAVAELTRDNSLFCYDLADYGGSVAIHKYFGLVHRYTVLGPGLHEWTVVYAWTPCKKDIDKAFKELEKNG